MAEATRTLYPKRIRNKAIEESIKLVMAQFQEQKTEIMAARTTTPRIEFPSAIRLNMLKPASTN